MKSEHVPRRTHLHVTVTVTLNSRLGWLVAGIVIGARQLPDLVLQVSDLLLRALGRP